MRIERAAALFHPELFEDLEVPRRPPRVRIKRCNLPTLQLLASLHILRLRVVYHQYLTSILSNNRSPTQEDFLLFLCCFLHFIIIIYRRKVSDNIMLGHKTVENYVGKVGPESN